MDAQFHPVMLAAWEGKLDRFVELLDDRPELVTARSTCSHPTLLQFVVLDGGSGKVDQPERFMAALLERGAALDEPLVAAASIGSLQISTFLLSAGAPVESGAPWTALEESIYWAHRNLANYLRDEQDAQVRSLRAAAGLGRLELVETFLHENRPGPNAGPVRYPWGTPSEDAQDVVDQALVIAAKNGRAEIVRRLLECGADANAFPPGIHEGGGAFHLAALVGREEVVPVLLDAGGDPGLLDPKHRSTPAGWAEHGGHADLALRLRELEVRAVADGLS